MPWVHRHRRRLPYSWFGTTTVRSHYRRSPGSYSVVAIVIALFAVILLIALLA